MSDYQPTDEQIEALAHRLRFHFEGVSAVRAALASDEFQSIIRAAQAEALRDAGTEAIFGTVGMQRSLDIRDWLNGLADEIEATDV